MFQDREQGVRFLVCEGDEEDGPYRDEPEKQRLHRRDTPHHLKNKRIHQQVNVNPENTHQKSLFAGRVCVC